MSRFAFKKERYIRKKRSKRHTKKTIKVKKKYRKEFREQRERGVREPRYMGKQYNEDNKNIKGRDTKIEVHIRECMGGISGSRGEIHSQVRSLKEKNIRKM